MAFVDKCKILIKAGDGGNGIVSWRREAHVPLGGPAGGNGGNGGNIFFVGDRNETSLENLIYRKKIVAKNGENGGIKNMSGHNAEDVYFLVPLGTIVKNLKNNKIVAEILEDKENYLIAKGGLGGHGNAHFKSGYNKAPTLYEMGEIGESFVAEVELKQISNIGLIGLPNAGKSSLISLLTNAQPKIANYQFTTLVPILGTLKSDNKRIVIADIPGLIEGASKGVGLGHDFLRHIERSNFLVHVVSLSKDDNPDIIKSINTIFNELKSYNLNLLNKKIIIVANKSDLDIENEQFKKIQFNFKKYPIICVSCLTKQGIDTLKQKLINEYLTFQETKKSKIIDWDNKKESKEKILDKKVIVRKIDDGIFDVESEYLEYWTHRIPINTPDNLIRLNQKISQTNMMELLNSMGAQEGDTIKIYKTILNYEK